MRRLFFNLLFLGTCFFSISNAYSNVPLKKGDMLRCWLNKVNVRKYPSLRYRAFSYLNIGDSVFYLGKKTRKKYYATLRGERYQEPFIFVRLKSGVTGWVYLGALISAYKNGKLKTILPDPTSGRYGKKFTIKIKAKRVISSNLVKIDYKTSFDMVLDKQERIHICYYDQKNGDLKYTYKNSGSWKQRTLDKKGDVGAQCSLSVDRNNRIHIFYSDTTRKRVYEIVNTQGLFRKKTFFTKYRRTPPIIRCGFDQYNNQHLFYRENSGAFYYAKKINKRWRITNPIPIKKQYSVRNISSLAFDKFGCVSVAYCHSVKRNIYMLQGTETKKIPKKWHDSCIERRFNSLYYSTTCMKIDNSNAIHIFYSKGFNIFLDIPFVTAIMYLKKRGNKWYRERLISIGGGLNVSMALDKNNNVHLSYYDPTGKKLKYATNKSGYWIYYTIDSNKHTGKKSKITVDKNSQVHICYTDEHNKKLRYVTF